MKVRIISHLAAAFIASALVLIGMFAFRQIEAWHYARSPYAPAENIEVAVTDGRMVFSATIMKTAPCDPTGAPPSFVRWSWRDSFGRMRYTTSEIQAGDRPLIARRVVPPGVPVHVGPWNSMIPKEITLPARASIIVVCNRGDGKFRAYDMQPEWTVAAQ